MQVEVKGIKDHIVMPIVRLQQGSTECCNPNISFSDAPVRFTLLKGCGPVHLIGNHVFSKLAISGHPVFSLFCFL